MDPVFDTFFNIQFLIFSVAVGAAVFVIKTIAEYAIAHWKPFMKETSLWNELLLPILPIVVGSMSAILIKSFPYPDNLTSRGSRFIFGLVAGLLSHYIVKFITAILNQRIAAASPASPTDDKSMSAGKNLE